MASQWTQTFEEKFNPPSHIHSHKKAGTQRLSAILDGYSSAGILRPTADDAKAYASKTELAEATANIKC